MNKGKVYKYPKEDPIEDEKEGKPKLNNKNYKKKKL